MFGHRAAPGSGARGRLLPRLHLFQLPHGGMVLVVSQSADGVHHRVENSEDAHKRPNKIQLEDCWYHRVQGQEHLAERGRYFIMKQAFMQNKRAVYKGNLTPKTTTVKSRGGGKPEPRLHAFPGRRKRPASVRKSRTCLFSIPLVFGTHARTDTSPIVLPLTEKPMAEAAPRVVLFQSPKLRRRQRKQMRNGK